MTLLGTVLFHIRFWYENRDVFTRDQLQEIKKVTLGRVICDNTDIKRVQRDVFLLSRDYRRCDNEIRSVNLERWRTSKHMVVLDCFKTESTNSNHLCVCLCVCKFLSLLRDRVQSLYAHMHSPIWILKCVCHSWPYAWKDPCIPVSNHLTCMLCNLPAIFPFILDCNSLRQYAYKCRHDPW